MSSKTKVQSIEPNIADMANDWLKSYKPVTVCQVFF